MLSIRTLRRLIFVFPLLSPFAATAADPDFVALSAAQSQALGIRVEAPRAAGHAGAANLPATVSIPNAQQRVIAAPLPGVVESLLVAPGEDVKAGQLLARIASPQALELQRDLLQAQAQATLAQQSLGRDEQLFKEGLIAASRLDSTRANARLAAAQAGERSQALRLAQASGGQTLSLTAPIAGNVLEQMVSVGQRVDQAAPLFRIARLDPLAVDIQAPLAIARMARVGTPLSLPGSGARGALVTVGRAVDAGSQSVLLRGLVTHGAEQLRPGQAIAVDLQLAPDNAAGSAPGSAVSVPAAAIFRLNDKTWVFVAAVDGKTPGYRAHAVTVAGRAGDAALVSGLPLDARVVSSGIAALKASWTGIGKE